jgi:hypothetical protein
MSLKNRGFWLVAIVLATSLAWCNLALAWDVQEKCTNTTGQPAHDLTKIVLGQSAVTSAITNQLGTPSIVNFDGVSIIHWGPGGTPVSSTPPNNWVWGCFNAATQPNLIAAYWTNASGQFIGLAAVEVTFHYRWDGGHGVLTAEHTWHSWVGTGYPPAPSDHIGPPLGPITGTNVYWAATDHLRPLTELNDALYTDPSLTWAPLDDFSLLGSGATQDYTLSGPGLDSASFLLLRFVAAGEGLSTPTIQQIPLAVHAIPTVSQWGLIILTLLLLASGIFVVYRRRLPAAR